MGSKLRWGIMGTGNIARQFASGVGASRRGVLASVGSRTADAASAFAAAYGVEKAFGSYQAMLDDPSTDAIYLSLPNTMHHEWTLKSLASGKHVLCEKPLAVNAGEAQEMFDAARRAGKLLVEAFMYRAHPQTVRAVELIRSGEIGKLQLIRTSFCYRVRKLAGNIRFDASLAGGALMDVGCYCLSLSRHVAGEEPDQIHAVSRRHASGVDEQTSVILHFPSGVTAEFTVGMMAQADNTAHVCGDEGYLKIPVPWKPLPGKAEVIIGRSIPPRQDDPTVPAVAPAPVVYPIDDERNVYCIEADAFAACVLDFAPAFVTESDTMGNMRALDSIRRQIGLA